MVTTTNFLKAAIKEEAAKAPKRTQRPRAVETKSIAKVEPVEYTVTENGSITYTNSGNKVLDFFAHGGAKRKASEAEILQLFEEAYLDNPVMAILTAFYLRDVREGQGERRLFRLVLSHLAMNKQADFERILPLVPDFGRWDDLFFLINIPKYKPVLKELITNQLLQDFNTVRSRESGTKSISNLAKWLPSESAGKKSKALAAKFRVLLGLKADEYRKILSRIRKQLNIVEIDMCANNWENIDYTKVASRAFYIYRKAFHRHTKDKFEKFITKAKAEPKSKATKVNAATLYPHEIVSSLIYGNKECKPVSYGWGNYRTPSMSQTERDALEVMWNNLPNWMSDANALAFADVSGSMQGLPMAVSIALALYISDKNQNEAWKDVFFTFSSSPRMENLKGMSFQNKISKLHRCDGGGNTNLKALFEMILRIGKQHKLEDADMPKTLLIISDMQFDRTDHNKTLHQQIVDLYKKAGYTVPKIVYWNVDSRVQESPVKYNEMGVATVSGFSPAILSQVLGKIINPLDTMHKTILSDRYKPVLSALMA